LQEEYKEEREGFEKSIYIYYLKEKEVDAEEFYEQVDDLIVKNTVV